MRLIPALFAGIALTAVTSVHAAIVWSTGATDVTFSKAALADPTLAVNQDRISPTVWITRGSVAGLYNAVSETAYAPTSPAGTRWAVSNVNGNPNFTYGTGAAMYQSLTFSDWDDALGSMNALRTNILAETAVLHLVAEDVYLDIKFTAWAAGRGDGSFSYVRANGVVPEPASLAILSAGAMALLARRKRG